MGVPTQETMHDLLDGSQLVLRSEYARIIPVHGSFSIRKADNSADVFTVDDSGNVAIAGTLTTTGGDTFDAAVTIVVTSSAALDVQNASATSFFKVNTSATPAITVAAPETNSFVGVASKPALKLSGAWFTGGSATTTKPQLLIEDSAATTTGWSTSGTGIGVNALTGFAGNLLDLQVNGTSFAKISAAGLATVVGLTTSGAMTNSTASLVSAPASKLTGAWYSGGSATTTKPHMLIEPSAATSTGWSTAGTGLGVNSASGFTGNLLDLQVNGTSFAKITAAGLLTAASAGIGTAATSQFGILFGGTITASGGSGGVGSSSANVNASANSDTIYGLRWLGTYSANGFTTVAGYGLYVTPTWSLASGTFGAITGMVVQGTYVASAGANTGFEVGPVSGGATGNIGLRVKTPIGTGAVGLQVDGAGILVSAGTSTIAALVSSGASGVASSIGTTAAGLTLSTTTSGTLAVTSAGLLTLTGVGASVWTPGAGATIVSDATTGIKIGTGITEKLGFYNAAPIAQRAGAAQAAVVTTAATLTTPYGYATQAQADAIVALVNELRAWAVVQGFIKGSA